ncbi:hypothetical protein KIN20_003733 [Parelaphostrongylus tenuis]|uniref:Uncharacterized protein n=1 Tax=Parelaphostrongylus tenuis TaxID=148309 RepID=A0AAD5MQC5_PARTN|nr:hypothetical protein KIN20_003733 [Parelaphostrongylus tenuis]
MAEENQSLNSASLAVTPQSTVHSCAGMCRHSRRSSLVVSDSKYSYKDAEMQCIITETMRENSSKTALFLTIEAASKSIQRN